MNTIARLKADARKHEQAEDWAKAIDAYAQVIQLGEQPDGDGERELPLFNRIGDLFVRLGRPVDAVSYYEDAADRYAGAGFYNNAIALCNKALRYMPERVELYRKLGTFSAAQGFLTDSRRWFLDYAEAMFRQGNEDDAFAALGELAGMSADPEVRLLLGRKLHVRGRTDDAVVELTRAYGMYLGTDEAERAAEVRAEILTLDALADPDTAVALAAAMAEIGADEDAFDNVQLDEHAGGAGSADRNQSDIGLQGTAGDAVTADDIPATPMAGLEVTARAAPDVAPAVTGQLEGFEATDLGGGATLPTAAAGGEDTPGMAEAAGDAAAPPALDAMAGGFDLPQLEPDTVPAEETSAAFDLPLLDFGESTGEDVVAVDLHAGLALAWHELEGGRTDAARATLDTLHERLAGQGQYLDAVAALDARIELDPEALPLHQLRVEYAQQSGDEPLLAGAYEALAAALTRAGAREHAIAVRQQLAELEGSGADQALPASEPPGDRDPRRLAPSGEAGQSATRTAPAALPAATDQYVDLAAMLAEERPAETRFFVEEKAPTGDEDLDFADLLAQFKTKLSENLDHDDAGSHYDLGLAFKDMGLLDEAIAAFQVALRTGDARLGILEELGQCFFLKGQHGIALKVLQRALELQPADEMKLIGVYYYLGRAAEADGQRDVARDAYERVLGLELGFQDAEQRLARL